MTESDGMHLDIWIIFLITTTLASLAPGPAVLMVLAVSLRAGARAAFWSIAAIMIANLVYFAVAAAGLKAVASASETLFQVVKWAGAAYLVWLGLQAFRGRAAGLSVSGTGTEGQADGWGLFRAALVMQAANPKAYLYLIAILPQFVDPAAPVLGQMAVIVPTAMIAELVVLTGYAQVAGRVRQMTLGGRFVGLANRAAGVMLIAAGLLVANLARP